MTKDDLIKKFPKPQFSKFPDSKITKEKPKEKPITTRDYYETYSGGCGNTYGGFSRSGGC